MNTKTRKYPKPSAILNSSYIVLIEKPRLPVSISTSVGCCATVEIESEVEYVSGTSNVSWQIACVELIIIQSVILIKRKHLIFFILFISLKSQIENNNVMKWEIGMERIDPLSSVFGGHFKYTYYI